ncbi:MAG: hypothetical protein V1800_08175 [Candidatus Latescibacterota bacterium]
MYAIDVKKRRLQESAGKLRIGIFREEGFPASSIPRDLTPEWMKSILEREHHVVFLDQQEMSAFSLIRPEFLDLIILPYGECFSAGGFLSGEFRTLKDYVEDGGSLLTTGGRPFWKPMEKTEGVWKAQEHDPYTRFLAELGIKTYEPENPPADFVFDAELLPGCPSRLGRAGAAFGLTVTTSDGRPSPDPPAGHVFPERIPERGFEVVARGVDRYGRTIASSVLIARNWRTGSRWCLIGNTDEAHPLNPAWEGAEPFLRAVVRQLASPLMAWELHPDYACYRQGEKVRLSIQTANFSLGPKRATLAIVLSAENGEILRMAKDLVIEGGKEETVRFEWHPKSFSSDLYTVEARLYDDGLLVGRTTNGFVVWDEKVLKSGPSVRVRGEYFEIGEGDSVFTGVNYYESTIGELMWLKPNVHRIASDLKQMSGMGINYLRPHYHHSKWFRDYFKYANHEPLPEYFEMADSDPLPSERSLRIFDAFIQLSQKYGIVYGGDLFTLVPIEMGDPRGWIEVFEPCADPRRVEMQAAFLKILGRRYADVPGISWDLWNEPGGPFLKPYLDDWVRELRAALSESGDRHPITVGRDRGILDAALADWDCFHGFEIPDSVEKLGKPCVFQEVWMNQDSSLEGDRKQRGRLVELFHKAFKVGGAGFVPWSWTRQARLWNNNKRWAGERWDDELGCCVREDQTVKPAGGAYHDLIALLSGVTMIACVESGRIKTSAGELLIEPPAVEGYFADHFGMAHLSAGKLLMVECRGAVSDKERKVLVGEPGALLMAFSKDGLDIRDAAEVFVKMDRLGTLKLHGRKETVAACLVETNGKAWRKVCDKTLRLETDCVCIELEPDDANYWVRLTSGDPALSTMAS